MPVPRRQLLQALAATAALAPPTPAQMPSTLAPDRIRLLEPILERRRVQLQSLRDFEIDDSIAPLRGPLAP